MLRYAYQRLSLRPLIRQLNTAAHAPDTCLQKPYYITTPIFYPNAAPHIGHLFTLVAADTFARFQRLLNPSLPVHFLTGTDEHGLKIQKAAAAAGENEEAFVARLSTVFRKLADEAHISYTSFMRTTQKEHMLAVEDVWRRLDAAGLIYKGEYSGWYSITDECFYTDAQVTHLPNAPQASDSTSASPTRTIASETGSPVEWTREENYMLRISALRSEVLAQYEPLSSISNLPVTPNQLPIIPIQYLTSTIAEITLPDSTSMADLSISRPRSRLSWGVPVPGDKEHTIYVWFDALLVYLSGTRYPWDSNKAIQRTELAKRGMQAGWPPNLQIIGKDILRFHAIYLPAILCALSLPSSKQLLSHAHWTVEGKKMSKSLGNVVDPFGAIDKHGIDIIRFYLCRIGGRWRDDVDWSHGQLIKHSKEVQSLLGNYFLRITSSRIHDALAPAPKLTMYQIVESIPSDPTHPLAPILELATSQRALGVTVRDALLAHELSDALDRIIMHLRLANKTLSILEPWASHVPAETTYACYVTALETLRVVGICLQPFVPGVAKRLLDALGVPKGEARAWAALEKRVGEVTGDVRGIRLFKP